MVVQISYFKKIVIIIVFLILIFFSLPNVCAHDDHGHHEFHDHGIQGHSHEVEEHSNEEPPSFKWSREANEAYKDVENKHSESDEQLQAGEIPSPYKTTSHTQTQINTSESDPNLWLEAMGATLLISVAPYLILFIIPVTNSKEHEPYLKILLAFASGGLLGDAFLHLIPHALMAQGHDHFEHSHSQSHSHSQPDSNTESPHSHSHDTTIGISVLSGIIVFLIVEKFVRIFKGGHSHSHSHVEVPLSAKISEEVEPKNKESDKFRDEQKNDYDLPKIKENLNNSGNMKVAGYLNLAADFTHNFTDGLAIGASFLAGKSIGIVTTLTIFLHEIPHEIGDFAILLQSGCSKRKAMLLQLITALGALTGTWVSLMAEGTGDSAVSWILPFTAGGFIYIATVSVIPELLENSHFWQSVAEVTALLLGVALMMIITWVEDLGHV